MTTTHARADHRHTLPIGHQCAIEDAGWSVEPRSWYCSDCGRLWRYTLAGWVEAHGPWR